MRGTLAHKLPVSHRIAPMRKSVHQLGRNVAHPLHVPSPVLPKPSGNTAKVLSYRANGNELPKRPIDQIDESALADRISQAVKTDFPSHKDVARAVDSTSIKTAENWTQGKTLPSLLYFLRLYAKSPAVRAEVRRLTAMESTLDPDFQRAFVRLMQIVQDE